MHAAPIVVIGSTNTDLVIRCPRFPRPGETLLGSDFLINPGGKGANQAVAVHRLGGSLTYIAKVGDDLFGRQTLTHFREAGIDTRFVFTTAEVPSGIALIAVDERAENSIILAPGANDELLPADIDRTAEVFTAGGYLLLQLETPLTTVHYAARLAREAGMKVVLNPAPARALPPELLELIDIITPNETEAETLTGKAVTDEASLAAIAADLHGSGIGTVIITLGSRGAYVSDEQIRAVVPAPAVEAVDTTAAGDVFNGALVAALAENQPLPDALAFANRAAALSVTRRGAQASIPFRAAI